MTFPHQSRGFFFLCTSQQCYHFFILILKLDQRLKCSSLKFALSDFISSSVIFTNLINTWDDIMATVGRKNAFKAKLFYFMF